MAAMAFEIMSWYSCCVSLLFLLISPVRLWRLRVFKTKVIPSLLGYIKVVLSVAYLIVQLLSLLLVSTLSKHWALILSDTLSFVAAVSLALLSFIQHRRSVRPSPLVILYLLASLVGNAILLTAPSKHLGTQQNTSITLSRVCLELAFLIFESQSKQSILSDPYLKLAPDEMAGVLGEILFWWINPILRHGYRHVLTTDDLPDMNRRLTSKRLRRDILKSWDQRVKPERKTTLLVVLLRSSIRLFLLPILPRLFLVVFRYSQAVVICLVIRFVNQTKSRGDAEFGYWLVLGAVAVYVGMAVSTATYQHYLNRLSVMTRGALVGLLHHRAMNVQSDSYEDGQAVTLMSTDVDGVVNIGEIFHEAWAQLVEVTVGTAMLACLIGWFALVPLVIIFFCSQMSAYVAKHLKTRQMDWNIATQKRISAVASLLAGVKSMKMLGMSVAMQSHISDLRNEEISISKRLRWMIVAYNASANTLGIFSPVITLIFYAIGCQLQGHSPLDTATAFTSVALLVMVTHPANMIMTIVPRAVASLASFERIQTYLLESSRMDSRLTLPAINNSNARQQSPPSPAVLIRDMTVQIPFTSLPILRNINCRIEKGSVLICAGPVGSGKTTLARAIIGEVHPSEGSISVSTKRIGLCTQRPWLPSTSIRGAISGGATKNQVDSKWYKTVVDACGLRPDLDCLPDKDETQIGSRGITLSGGQRQRVALARAVYARCEIVVLDDPFSALDGKTEDYVINNLLGLGGIFQKLGTTVFLITNSVHNFPLADQIIVLGNSTIQMRGAWNGFRLSKEEIKLFCLQEQDNRWIEPARSDDSLVLAQKRSPRDTAEDILKETDDFSVYAYYFKAVGTVNVLLMMNCTAVYSFFLTFSHTWLKWWTESGARYTTFYLVGYLLISLLAWSAANGTAWSMHIRVAPQSGAVLHHRLLRTMIRAPLSYFSLNDIGVILNRFGQDIQLVDRQLPSALVTLSSQVFKLIMQATLLFTVQPMMATALPLCTVVIYFLQRVYLRTSRQLRFLELESRSAVYTSFLETIEGIATIRAFGWQKSFGVGNIQLLEKSQRPFYLFLCLQRWLNIILDLLVAAIAVGVIALAVAQKFATSGAQVGVALNMILAANTTLLRLVESWTDLEISSGAIARLRSVVLGTPQEEQFREEMVPANDWPSTGAVELDKIGVSYNPNTLTLNDVSINIKAGHKLIVCGRTGSGKSTVLLALLRLLELQSGAVRVDGADLSPVPHETLRQRCFITVPQYLFILPEASLRFNLDPYGACSDSIITKALEKTHLWQHFSISSRAEEDASSRPDSSILDMPVSILPPLSAGQLQLFSFARALLRAQATVGADGQFHDTPVTTKPILLLDEATSSLDPQTEMIIHDLIEKEFTNNGYTVIAITHRSASLRKVMRPGDAVVWMSGGKVKRMEEI